ncbi:hypothetical protein FJY63_08935, partial [Candidatus Sumerlaeota bacterium]|nr:hypothetical protein [Candidatus Sumerlaeota bacterium]
MPLSKKNNRRPLLALAFSLLLLGGCAKLSALTKQRGDLAAKNPIEATLRLAQAQVRPGEAVIAYVWIKNIGSKSLSVQVVDASSVEFYANRSGEITHVRPVVSRKELLGTTVELPPGGILPASQARTFVLVTLSDRAGACALQAVYRPATKVGASALAPVYAKPVTFHVSGAPVCRRDRDGILVKADAIEIARRQVGRPVAAADASLHEDEMGLLCWTITLTIDPNDLKPGEPSSK